MAKRKFPVSDALAVFNKLTDEQKQVFVALLPVELLLTHGRMKRLLDICEIYSDSEYAHRTKLAKFFNPGKPERNALIDAHKATGLSHGQIGRQADVVAANGGKRMTAGAVQQVLIRRKPLRIEP